MDNKLVFKKLTPQKDVDIRDYEEAFDFVFKNDDVKNVAISGAYSSGKSSVLESYKYKHKEKSFLHISLTHFCAFGDDSSAQSESNNLFNESSLEGKILNQLIHQIPPEKIPQTSFKVKQTVNPKDVKYSTLWVCVFVLSIFVVSFAPVVGSFAEDMRNSFIKNITLALFSSYARIVGGLFCLICVFHFIYKVIKEQKTKNIFRKISFQGNEIEIFENQDDSYFDKYLNEVLYLFENVDKDVIIFEDIDRFDEPHIFERLREINTIVNTQTKKPLRFFYLIRDDIFTSKDRTKFFDFIIPIIPVIDSSNAYEQLYKALEENNMLNMLDKGFLQGLSLYIDDMRMLKNICNEFTIYISRLNSTELNYNKMMAIITYKNLFPRDFSELQLARGFVHELFQQKSELINRLLLDFQDKKLELSNRIEYAKEELLGSQKDLEILYKAKTERLPRDYYKELTPEGAKLKEQYDAEFFKKKQALQDKQDDNLLNLEAKLTEIEHEIALIQSRTLSELISRENINELFSAKSYNALGEVNEYKEIKRSEYFDLLKFLIRNGYIDETYNDYMSYFYPGSLKTKDKIFLRRVTDKRGSEFTYTLEDPKMIVESPVLGVADFEQEEVLNFDLFEYLLENDNTDKNTMYLKTLFSQIRENENYEFISKYYDSEKEYKNFVIAMNKQWPNFLLSVLHNNAIPSMQIRRFSIDTLSNSDLNDIENVNINNCLTDYISQCPDYLNIDQPDIEELVSGFIELGVNFKQIDYEVSNPLIFNKVYEQCLYAINFENIKLMLKVKCGIDSDFDITHKNYSLIKSQVDSPLANYIANNFEQYLTMVIENCDDKISDDESVVIDVLNRSDVDLPLKTSYINSLCTDINDISQIMDETLWPSIIDRGIICFSADNCLNYFLELGIDQHLIGFINDSPAEIDFSCATENFDNDAVQEFCNNVVICNDIHTKKYQKILQDLEYVFDAYDTETIQKEKIKALINGEILQMCPESLEFIRNFYPENREHFIRHNFNAYLELQNELFDMEETLSIIESDISDAQKIALLEYTDEEISIIGKNYSDEVASHILINNLDKTDLPALFEKYSKYPDNTGKAIVELAADEISNIISRKLLLDDHLLSALITSDYITRNQKIRLFTSEIPKMNENSCLIHLDELELSNFKTIFNNGREQRKYDKNEEAELILSAFKSRQWILDYHVDDNNTEKYVVIISKTS